jgi:ASC-1-like (ASCH) protein
LKRSIANAQRYVDSVLNGRDQVEDRLAVGVMAAIEVGDRYMLNVASP